MLDLFACTSGSWSMDVYLNNLLTKFFSKMNKSEAWKATTALLHRYFVRNGVTSLATDRTKFIFAVVSGSCTASLMMTSNDFVFGSGNFNCTALTYFAMSGKTSNALSTLSDFPSILFYRNSKTWTYHLFQQLHHNHHAVLECHSAADAVLWASCLLANQLLPLLSELHCELYTRHSYQGWSVKSQDNFEDWFKILNSIRSIQRFLQQMAFGSSSALFSKSSFRFAAVACPINWELKHLDITDSPFRRRTWKPCWFVWVLTSKLLSIRKK